MRRSRSPRAGFLLRRMRASRLLIGCVLLVTLVASTLLAALADFSAVFLSQAAEQQVASSNELAVQVNSTANAAQAGPANGFVTTSLRSAFGPQGLALQSALWSDPLDIPFGAPAGSHPIAEVAALGGIGRHVRLVAGAWPPQSGRRGQPYAVAVPAADASELALRPGQSLTLTDGDNGRQVSVQISGVYEIEDPAARYWGLDLISTSGLSVEAGFRTYGPLLTARSTFAAGGLAVGQRSWLATPASSAIPPASMRALAERVGQAVTLLNESQSFGGIVASTSMPQLLTGTAARYEVARALVATGGLELLLVASATLALTAGLLASDRAAESALLAARGLTRRQIGLLSLAEAATAAFVAAAVGVLLGALLATVLAGASSSLHGVRPAAAALSLTGIRPGWWPAVVVMVLAMVVLGWPSARSATAAGHRARSGRPAALATVSRASIDLAIMVLAALTAWQLRQYSAVAHGESGALGLDPVLAVAPALILAAVALVPLRLMPAATRLADRLATRGSGLTAALAAWQLSRRPVRQAGPALLAILAVGTSTMALAEQVSWRESVHAQAAAIVGADARVNVPPTGGTAALTATVTARTVRAAMPVTAFDGGLPGPVIALDADIAARVVHLRPDQSRLPATRLWRLITPSTRPDGLSVPARPIRLGLRASLGSVPASWQLGVLAASLSVQAADGVVYALSAGALAADGSSHLLTAVIPAADRVSYPLRLVGVTFTYQMPPVPAGTAASGSPPRVGLTISGFAASAELAGPLPEFAPGAAISRWSRTAVSAALTSNDLASGVRPTIGSWQPSGSGSVTAVVTPGDGQLASAAGPPFPISAEVALAAWPGLGVIPGIVTSSFASAGSVGIGSNLVAAVGGYQIPVHVVAEVSSFPTVGTGSALIIDQRAVQALLASVSAPPLAVTSWWLATSAGGSPAGASSDPAVTSLREVTARMLDDPVSAAPQQVALVIAVAVALLAALGFAVSVAASLTERRASNAILAALGLSRLSRARQLCLEQVLLATPAAAIGLLAGAAIAHLLIPAVTLTATAAPPTPPALVYLPLGWAFALAAVVALTPMVAAAVTVLSRPRPAAELRMTGEA